jgi:steroid delta-isomerase-like uncharacterized protein
MKEQITISNPFVIFLTILLGLVFITSSCQQANRETAATQHEELATSYIEAFNAQDRAALEELLADPQTDDGEEITREAYLERAEKLWDVFPDIEFEPTHVLDAEGYVAVRGVYMGTGDGEYRGYDIDDQEFEVSQIILFDVQEGQIAGSYAERDISTSGSSWVSWRVHSRTPTRTRRPCDDSSAKCWMPLSCRETPRPLIGCIPRTFLPSTMTPVIPISRMPWRSSRPAAFPLWRKSSTTRRASGDSGRPQ